LKALTLINTLPMLPAIIIVRWLLWKGRAMKRKPYKSFRRGFAVLPILLAVLVAMLVGGCGRIDQAPPASGHGTSADIARTTYGVAHIRSDSFRGLGYGLAYAYAQDNACMFADSLLTVRGERSRFFGADARATRARNGEYGAASDFMDLTNEDSDFFFKGYLDIEQLKQGYAKASDDARDMLAGYADGYNRYLTDYAGRHPAACNGAAWLGRSRWKTSTWCWPRRPCMPRAKCSRRRSSTARATRPLAPSPPPAPGRARWTQPSCRRASRG
jgi:hypothetical protein